MSAALFGLSLSVAPVHAADPAPAAAVGSVRLYVQAGFVPGSSTFRETRTFTEFAEQGHIDSQYTEDPGPGFEVALAWRFSRRLAVVGAVSTVRRKEGGSFSAALPHPLYFGSPRSAAGDFSGRHERETSVHLDLAWMGGSRRVQWMAFAGPSLIGVDADLVSSVQYTQAYPYDSVAVTGTPFAATRGHALGFNAGVGVDCRLAPHVALATLARLSRATVPLQATADDRVRVRGGGAALQAGLRLDF
ncbi:MAG TPA: hypothetical protein VGQ33_09315 [Vicinamibacteria bacterium]|nr:hypothetical protein [Vicinamibacteria bacterium]